MTPAVPSTSDAWAAAWFAVDPVGLGGVALRSAAGDARDRWLALLARLLPTGLPWRRLPLHIDDDRLLGGLDLAATLRAGRPVAQRGLLAEADGGIVVVAMAERMTAATAAQVAAVMDTRMLMTERDGTSVNSPSRIGVVALDEGIGEDEQMPARLRERLAFHLVLDAVSSDFELPVTRNDVTAARDRLAAVRMDSGLVETLCGAAMALGVSSLRASLLACRAARAMAALDGREAVDRDDASRAAALVLAPRATRWPEAATEDDVGNGESTAQRAAEEAEDRVDDAANDTSIDTHEPPAADDDAASPVDDLAEPRAVDGPIEDTVLAAALAAMPPGLLAALSLGTLKPARSSSSAGRSGAAQSGASRGRPTGVRRGEPTRGARLNLIETLRAAAPWQTMRQREARETGRPFETRVLVRREDFHVWRLRQRSETTTLFVVDASGSAALHRLAETKGAVELLLADCYVRRDSVAVIAFRGKAAELLLPPTRSLVRAKRSLAGLPGGGGTPLAAGIAAAHTLAGAVRRRGATPVVVLLTDGRANIALDGSPGRTRAGDDALAAARQMRADGFATLLLDTSPQAQEPARLLAEAMGARYLPLPHAGASTLSQAVRAVAA